MATRGRAGATTRAVRVAALLTATTQVPMASPADAIVSGRFRSSGVMRTYSACLPPKGHSHPLVILLHGSGGTGRDMVERWRDLARREGIIVAAPDATDRRQWQPPEDGPTLFRDLVDELAPHDVDRRRIYLFGHSAGAVFTLYMAPLESEYFAAAATHAGAYNGEADLGFLDQAPRKIPLFLTVGGGDTLFPQPLFLATVHRLERAGFPVTTWVWPDSPHAYKPSAAINERAWAFLRQHSLDREPVFVPVPFGPSSR
jgi:poly(3-hydroxybutyrate) depolymerase